MPSPDDAPSGAGGTAGAGYTRRLESLESARWKRWLDVQAPYRWNVRRWCRGRVLDVGCGIGRNLAHLAGAGVGIDHNAESVAVARSRGLVAYTPDEFAGTDYDRPGAFDTLLVAHVLEHVDEATGDQLLSQHASLVVPGGRVVLICPQEKGYSTDATHVRWVDDDAMAAHLRRLAAHVERSLSFPFPRRAGRAFPYNEFVVVGLLP